jgi:DNA repair protein RadA/Sms
VAQEQARLKEAAKLGFSNAVSPAPRVDKKAKERLPLPTSAIGHITDLVAGVAARRRKAS